MVGAAIASPELAQPAPGVQNMPPVPEGGLSYQRANGVIEYAPDRATVLRLCPFMGRLAAEDPQRADALMELAAMSFDDFAPPRPELSKPQAEDVAAKPTLADMLRTGQKSVVQQRAVEEKPKFVHTQDAAAATVHEAQQNPVTTTQLHRPPPEKLRPTATPVAVVAAIVEAQRVIPKNPPAPKRAGQVITTRPPKTAAPEAAVRPTTIAAAKTEPTHRVRAKTIESIAPVVVDTVESTPDTTKVRFVTASIAEAKVDVQVLGTKPDNKLGQQASMEQPLHLLEPEVATVYTQLTMLQTEQAAWPPPALEEYTLTASEAVLAQETEVAEPAGLAAIQALIAAAETIKKAPVAEQSETEDSERPLEIAESEPERER